MPETSAPVPTVLCQQCGEPTPPYEIINYGSDGDGYRELCGGCVNRDAAKHMGIDDFSHVRFAPVTLKDAAGVEHVFHFRVRLFGHLAIDAFELVDGEPGGYQFQVLESDDRADAWGLFVRLIERIRRALAITHLSSDRHGMGIVDRTVRGRIESDPEDDGGVPVVVIDGRPIAWNEFGRLLMGFEGWQFRVELIDRSEEA